MSRPSARNPAEPATVESLRADAHEVGSRSHDAREFSALTADERIMVVRARAGDERAMRQIYRLHQARVRGHLHRLLGDDADVDDVLQTVFSRAFAALDRFKGESTLRTWLYRITANTTHNLLRKRYRQARVRRAFGQFVNATGSSVPPSRMQARDEARRALASLPPDLQEIFVLYHYEGLTLQEISDVQSRPISTIGDRLTRARKRLKKAVDA